MSPHSRRRTYASLRAASGDDPVYIAEQGGWRDPTFALRVYAKAVKRRERLDGPHLRAFDAALEWGRLWTNVDQTGPKPSLPSAEGMDAESLFRLGKG